jgi:hypothetical protein
LHDMLATGLPNIRPEGMMGHTNGDEKLGNTENEGK